MGSKQSQSASQSETKTEDSQPAGGGGCWCLCLPRMRWPSMWHKLRRSVARRLRRVHHQRRRVCSTQRLARCLSSAALLRPMPRCSSFGSSGTLLTTTPMPAPGKRAKPKGAGVAMDTHYARWKCMFEHAAATPTPQPSQRPHDITEALSGQTTPHGFPSHTDARKCQSERPQQQPQQQELFDEVGDIKVRRRLSFRLPKVAGSGGQSMRRPTARERVEQARLEAQMQRDLRDLEEYYGGFYFARRPAERLVGI